MKKAYWVALIPGALALAAGLLVLGLLVVKAVWGWVIPDLFPGAVKQGLIAGSISWYTAFKVAVFMAVFGGLAKMLSGGGRDD